MQSVLGPIPDERRTREAFLSAPDDSVRADLDAALASVPDPALRSRIEQVRQYAESLHYAHPGQTADVYMAHPFRVTTMYLRAISPSDVLGPSVALVHNALEVTDRDQATLAADLGPEIAESVALLTVDRAQQWDAGYKADYYARIEAATRPVRIVKLLDKVDNLFTLHHNPSDEIRRRYLAEIETHILPIARRDLPPVAPYVERLVADNRGAVHRTTGSSDDRPPEEDTHG